MRLMAVVNLSPESPQADSVSREAASLFNAISHQFEQGADFVDVGARSTYSKAPIIEEHVEQARLQPLFDICQQRQLRKISLDTWSPSTAIKALPFIDVLNYTATFFPDDLLEKLSESSVRVVINYMAAKDPYQLRKTPFVPFSPERMLDYFHTTLTLFHKRSIKVLAIDPNLGVWHPVVKPEDTMAYQLKIIEQLPMLKQLAPVLVIAPRKPRANQADGLNGELTTRLIDHQVDFLRTHDVAAVRTLLRQHNGV